MDRTILHCDMNAFYASVELLALPELADRPVAVCGDPQNRHGIILAKNQLAKGFGIVTAETVWQAKKKCPELVLVRPHHDRYKIYSEKINGVYSRFTDQIEPFSIDESWLDVTGSLSLFGSGREIADRIRAAVKEELGLTLSVGVSFNKVFAKMGSDYRKPDATTVIDRGNYQKLLWPMAVRELFFVGGATAEKLERMGIRTIGELACADRKLLSGLFGKHGEMIHDYANGIDESPVALFSEKQKIKSVGNGITFRRDLKGEGDIRTAVKALSDKVAGRLRRYKLKCQGVKVDIKDPWFKTISRQKQLSSPTNLAEEICKTALEIIKKSWGTQKPIRLLTITGINLVEEDAPAQLSLFDDNGDDREKKEQVERAMDRIREKYGGSAITYGSIIGNDIGIELKEEEMEHEEELNEENGGADSGAGAGGIDFDRLRREQ